MNMALTLFESSQFASRVLSRNVAKSASACLMTLCLTALVAVPSTSRAASDPAQGDPMALLVNIQQAARQLDYTGVFMYTQGDFTQSSRVVHMVDGTGSRERLEVLDGEPKEFIRHNDEVRCLMPERKKVLLETRRTDRFPGLLLGEPKGLNENYNVTLVPGKHRVAGRQCQKINIEPRDGLRYAYSLCADTETHLLLKAQTIAADRSLIEQVLFTSLRIGGDIAPESLQSSWSTQGWDVVEHAMDPVDLAAKGWRVPAPAGFVPLMQVERAMGPSGQVGQIVFSDGLAAISVFIEPYGSRGTVKKKNGPARHGAINVFGTRIADFWLTALGEVPVSTLQDLAESTEYVPLPQ